MTNVIHPDSFVKDQLNLVLAELNAKHFVVQVEGKTKIANIQEPGSRHLLTFSSKEDFINFYTNRIVIVDKAPMQLGKFWWSHSDRRQYDAIVFDPEAKPDIAIYNLWQGFSVEPIAGEWNNIGDFLKAVICDYNMDYFEWLFKWIARSVQHPGSQAEVAIVLRGPKGIGKGTFYRMLRKIFGRHCRQIDKQKHLVGHFNAHLMDCCLLFVDEAYWAGGKETLGAINRTVTEDTLFIEPKGLNPFEWPNRLKIIIASNNDWVVSATCDERRYFVLDVNPVFARNKNYWELLNKAIEDEAPAFLETLLSEDISDFDYRNAPHTKALNEQKALTFDIVESFWYETLAGGTIVDGQYPWPDQVAKQTVYERFLDHCKSTNNKHPIVASAFWKKTRKLFPGRLHETRPRYGSPDRDRNIELPELMRMRAFFCDKMRIPVEELFEDLTCDT